MGRSSTRSPWTRTRSVRTASRRCGSVHLWDARRPLLDGETLPGSQGTRVYGPSTVLLYPPISRSSDRYVGSGEERFARCGDRRQHRYRYRVSDSTRTDGQARYAEAPGEPGASTCREESAEAGAFLSAPAGRRHVGKRQHAERAEEDEYHERNRDLVGGTVLAERQGGVRHGRRRGRRLWRRLLDRLDRIVALVGRGLFGFDGRDVGEAHATADTVVHRRPERDRAARRELREGPGQGPCSRVVDAAVRGAAVHVAQAGRDRVVDHRVGDRPILQAVTQRPGHRRVLRWPRRDVHDVLVRDLF